MPQSQLALGIRDQEVLRIYFEISSIIESGVPALAMGCSTFRSLHESSRASTDFVALLTIGASIPEQRDSAGDHWNDEQRGREEYA